MRHNSYVMQICIALLLCLANNTVYANIYAAHVQLDFDGTFPATIRYRLNEDATNVTVSIKKEGSVVRRLIATGDQLTRGHEASMQWDGLLEGGESAPDGVYTVEIEAASMGHTVWTLLSDRFGTDTKMTNVRGVAVNKNNGSVNFGRIYVLQQQSRIAGPGMYRPRGVWLYRNDLSFWGDSQETAYASGNFYCSLSEYCNVSVWCSWYDTQTLASITDYADSNGPFRITVDSADYIYVSTSLVDALGGVTVGDPNFSIESVFFLLNRLPFTNFGSDPSSLSYCTFEDNIWTTDSLDILQTYGVTRNHGLCSGMWVDGVGADRVLYVCDCRNGSGYMDETWGQQQVVKFAVGDHVEQGLAYKANPEVVLSNEMAPEATEIQFDAHGNLYVGGAYNRAEGVHQYHSLQKFRPVGDSYELVWERIVPNTIQTMGIAYDPRSNRLAVTDLETTGYIRIFNTETGAKEDEFFTWAYALRNNDIDFDPAGNIIGANQTIGQVICLSPPDGPNSFVTKSGYAFSVGADAGVIVSKVNRSGLKSTPAGMNLAQNYPNPFNPSTRINYSIIEPGHVTLKIYNNIGQLVKTLVDKHQSKGDYSIEWDGTDQSGDAATAGLYLYHMQTDRASIMQKMLLIK
ncbi:MAG TPA: FlgD immunoglobulin-like domain containing protein [bacterium]|nr:FlgD immunoglobulin-like domain containing protein [bacterium]